MQSFTYLSPTEVIFGKDTQNKVAECVRKYDGSRVLLVYGGGSVIRSGLLGQVRQVLADAGLACEEFGGVQPNPTLEHAKKGIRSALEFQADFLLGVGGGDRKSVV